MSVVPVSVREISIRVARVVAIGLTYAFIGSLIQFASVKILLIGYAVLLSGLTEDILATTFLFFLAGQPILPTSMSLAYGTGLTGLIAGVCDAIFGRVNARTMLVISLVMVLVSLGLGLRSSAPMLMNLFGSTTASSDAMRFFLVPLAIDRFFFVVSMMVCWKLVDIVRGKTPAAGSLAPS
jgi:hypothetical protein